jgi:hypothetical protein
MEFNEFISAGDDLKIEGNSDGLKKWMFESLFSLALTSF